MDQSSQFGLLFHDQEKIRYRFLADLSGKRTVVPEKIWSMVRPNIGESGHTFSCQVKETASQFMRSVNHADSSRQSSKEKRSLPLIHAKMNNCAKRTTVNAIYTYTTEQEPHREE